MVTEAQTVHEAFEALRHVCDPRGHGLLETLEELYVNNAQERREAAAVIADVAHQLRVIETLESIRSDYGQRMAKWPDLRSIG